jgi:hypothetical protein
MVVFPLSYVTENVIYQMDIMKFKVRSNYQVYSREEDPGYPISASPPDMPCCGSFPLTQRENFSIVYF